MQKKSIISNTTLINFENLGDLTWRFIYQPPSMTILPLQMGRMENHILNFGNMR
jgi:hypothetical protein